MDSASTCDLIKVTMEKKEELLKFFELERRFLARTVDLRRVLVAEGWKAVTSPLGNGHAFHYKGRIVTVYFHNGQDAYVWEDEAGVTGQALDLLKDGKIADHKQRFMAALKKLKGFADRFHPEATQRFYEKHGDVVQRLRSNHGVTEIDPYKRMEKELLFKELSIFKVAYELGYRPSPESKSGRTYYRKGKLSASFKRNDEGLYLWYDHEVKRGGTIQDFVSFDLGIDKDAAYERLKDFALHFILPERLDVFMIEAFAVRAGNFPIGSFAARLEAGKTVATSESISSRTYRQEIADFVQGYESQSVFKSWSTSAMYSDVLPRHFRVPELNPAFRRISESLGAKTAKELARVALVQLAARKMMPESLEVALNNPALKSDVKTVLEVIRRGSDLASGGSQVTLQSVLKRLQASPSLETTGVAKQTDTAPQLSI